MKKTLGQRIRELRDEHDLSLREFAKKLGDVTAAHLSDIELGRRYPSDSLLTKIARVFRVPYQELQSFDNRAPVDDLKRLAELDPAFGFALRRLVEDKVDADEILKLLENRKRQEEE